MKALEREFDVDAVNPLTMIDALIRDVARKPDDQVFTFVQNDGVTDEVVSYSEFEQLVTRIARSLQAHIKSDDGQLKAILLLPPGKEFVSTFYACLAAGVVAVPSFPIQNDLKLDRLKLMVKDLGNPIVIGDEETLKNVQPYLKKEASDIQCLLFSDLITESPGQFMDFVTDPDAIAMLQYTSGSTGSPKGVIINNSNLVENSQLIKDCFGHVEGRSKALIWLPPYHDMGLVGGVLQGVYSSFPMMLVPTSVFLRNQSRWLECISRFKATSSGGPNFAFELCTRNVRDSKLPDLDLSSWNVAFCGAEPINHQTMVDFSNKFAQAGFNPDAIYPCYGMAEATLMISGKPLQTHFRSLRLNQDALSKNRIESAPADAQENVHNLVSCGKVHHSIECQIVDPTLQVPMGDGEIGEVWISGSSIAQGYWNKPEQTDKDFGRTVAGSDGRFHRTGDLGFLRDGELYVTGRIKEVVIIRGANYYPQDIEFAAKAACSQFKNCRMAAFSSDTETGEPLVLGVEVPKGFQDFESVAQDIDENLINKFGIKPDRILFFPRRTVKVTSSGKLQRLALKKSYLSKDLQAYFSWPVASESVAEVPASELSLDATSVETIAMWIRSNIAKKVNMAIEAISPNDQFASFGLDSVTAMDILFQLEAKKGVYMSPEILYQYNTPQGLAEEIFRQLNQQATA